MSNLEEKFLGEEAAGYCSSSDSEGEEVSEPSNAPLNEATSSSSKSYRYSSQNTGPKGVISDWHEYKKFQESCQRAQEKFSDDTKQMSIAVEAKSDDNDLENLLSEEELQEFTRKRMEQLSHMENWQKHSGVAELKSSEEFLVTIDEKHKDAKVCIHIYDPLVKECRTMNDCLEVISKDYAKIKFCKIRASLVGVSLNFKRKGVPALLLYKNGVLIGNFVQLKDEFGSNFHPGDVENFLIEVGVLQERSN